MGVVFTLRTMREGSEVVIELVVSFCRGCF